MLDSDVGQDRTGFRRRGSAAIGRCKTVDALTITHKEIVVVSRQTANDTTRREGITHMTDIAPVLRGTCPGGKSTVAHVAGHVVHHTARRVCPVEHPVVENSVVETLSFTSHGVIHDLADVAACQFVHPEGCVLRRVGTEEEQAVTIYRHGIDGAGLRISTPTELDDARFFYAVDEGALEHENIVFAAHDDLRRYRVVNIERLLAGVRRIADSHFARNALLATVLFVEQHGDVFAC